MREELSGVLSNTEQRHGIQSFGRETGRETMKATKSFVLMSLVVIASCGAASQSLAQEDSKAPVVVPPANADQNVEPSFNQRVERYHLLAGDVVELTFEFSPEFNQVVVVQPDGYITLRNAGDIHVEGQTVPELTSTCQKAYEKILNKPAISVVIKDFQKPYFIASGEVAHPGKYDLRGNTTLTQAIAVAGGFTEKSKHSQVLLFRRVSDTWTEARTIDIKKMLRDKNLGEDPYLRPGDMLFVPQNFISKIARYIPTPSVGTYVNPTHY